MGKVNKNRLYNIISVYYYYFHLCAVICHGRSKKEATFGGLLSSCCPCSQKRKKKRKKKALCFAVLQPKKREESGVVPFPASYVCPVPYILHACTMHFMRHIKARRELSPSFVQAVSFWGRDNRDLFHFAACSWMLFHQLRKEALFEKMLSLTQLSLGNCSERNTIFGRISV